MHEFLSGPRNRCASVVVFMVFASFASGAQQPSTPKTPAPSPQGGAQTSPANQDRPTPDSKANDELLARASKLYFSTASVGLDGFDCAVQPDWHALFVSANKGTAIAEDDSRIVLLKTVKITLHARLKGGSTLDWVPDTGKPVDQDSTSLLDQMHKATEQTLQGFLQFWIPFVDGSVVPQNSQGLQMTHTADGFTLHSNSNGTEVTEVMSNDLILQQFNVVMGGNSIKFSPSYQSTEKGLLVNRFVSYIQMVGPPPGPVQEMHVEIYYQPIDGVPITAKLNMEVIGTGIFNFALDGCQVSKASK
jgi:hypothetical protein